VITIPKKKVCNFVGGEVSPILANVYLHELDTFIAGLKAEFDQGARRAANPEYEKYRTHLRRLRVST
jgi:RNA-directed DNA polymerase